MDSVFNLTISIILGTEIFLNVLLLQVSVHAFLKQMWLAKNTVSGIVSKIGFSMFIKLIIWS